MEYNSQRITELTIKHLKGELSPAEQEELNTWLTDPYNRARFEERVKPENILEGVMLRGLAQEEPPVIDWSRAQETGDAKVFPMGEPELTRSHRFRWIAAAAVVAALAGTSLWWFHQNRQTVPENNIVVRKEALNPGGNKATLILSDQREIALDDAHKGEIAQQGNARVSKADNSLLAYSVRGSSQQAGADDNSIAINTLITPRGGQYQLRLADGTTVFLNAQSSLKFPVAFNGKERRVILQGEGYFEVASDPARPFLVEISGGKEVRVLGTRFDVQDYADDPAASTVLLEGKVRVESGSKSAVLGVDERATIGKDGELKTAHDEHAEASIAWTMGMFRFSNVPLTEVMRQLSRWYDVDVRFQGTPPEIPITASISRNTSAWQILDALKDIAGIQYQVEGKTILVLH